MSTDQVIHLEKVNKWYDDFHVLKDIDLIVNKGQKIVICGPCLLYTSPSPRDFG